MRGLYNVRKHLQGQHDQQRHAPKLTAGNGFGFGEEGKEVLSNVNRASDELALDVLTEYRADPDKFPAITEPELIEYLNRNKAHRNGITEEALKFASKNNISPVVKRKLFRNLVIHDVDKYAPDVAEAYADFFAGRTIEDVDRFKAAIRKHHDISPHHYEYWANFKTRRAKKIPREFMYEMIGDIRYTAKERGTPSNTYYERKGASWIMHPDSRRLLEKGIGAKEINPNRYKRR